MPNLLNTKATIEQVNYSGLSLKTADGVLINTFGMLVKIRRNDNEEYVPYMFSDNLPLNTVVDILYSTSEKVCLITSEEIKISQDAWFDRLFAGDTAPATSLKMGENYYVRMSHVGPCFATKGGVSTTLMSGKLLIEMNNGNKVPYTEGFTHLKKSLYTVTDISDNEDNCSVTVKSNDGGTSDTLPNNSGTYDHVAEFCKLIGSTSNTANGAATIILRNVLHKLDWKHEPSVELYETSIANWLYHNVNKVSLGGINPQGEYAHMERVNEVTCLLFGHDVSNYIHTIPFGTDSFKFEGVKYDGKDSFHIIMPGGERLEDTLKAYKED